MKFIHFSSLLLLLVAPLASAKQIIGIYESVSLPTEGLELKAKIDSGAKNTSLHALNINIFKQNGKDWVAFETVNEKGNMVSLSAPVHRIAKIKRHNAPSQSRPVIIAGVCIGNVLRNVEVNLIDRSKLNYPLLIGRSYIEGNFLIDVALSYTVQPNC
jgi:hypothetical protein